MLFSQSKLLPSLLAALLVTALAACAPLPPPAQEFRSNQQLSLEEAVSLLGQKLKAQLETPRPAADPLTQMVMQATAKQDSSPQMVVLDPFIAYKSGQQLKINTKIVSILARELGSRYDIVDLDQYTQSRANYILAGAISQRPGSGRKTAPPGYDLVVNIIEWPSGTIRAKGLVWVRDMPFEPLAIYEDSPIYLQDKSARMAAHLFSVSLGNPVGQEYLQFLPVKGMLQQGIYLYDQGRYEDAAKHFKQAIATPSGNTLTANAGLYLASQKLGKEKDTDLAFANMLTIAIEENRKLDIRLLFGVNSPAFIPNAELVQRYAWWLKQIATHMEKSAYCLEISGHCSHTGDETYNARLSLARARTVQGVMSVTYPGIRKKSKVTGKGFHENIVGTGTDDASDALDRRVEFKILACRELQ